MITNIQNIIDDYKDGKRYFINLDFDKGEKLGGLSLIDSTFENCCLSVDFRRTNLENSKFLSCNLKCSDFTNCNLSNTTFEECLLEGVLFEKAIIEGIILKNCYCYGQVVKINKTTNELMTKMDPLVKELYSNIPEFIQMTDHSNDELSQVVFGELSLKLFDDIKNNDSISDFTKKSFQFFNIIGNRNEESIDNLLVEGIYEGLYANKKCNLIARQLLTERNRKVYEYWMINGNIRSEY